MSNALNLGGYPPGFAGPDDDPSWADEASDQEIAVESPVKGCVFVRDCEAVIDDCDGVTAWGTVSLTIEVEGPLSDWCEKARNALAAVVHQMDMRSDRATADDRTLRLEV